MNDIKKGVDLCEEALERLIIGKPNYQKFLGKKITASLVSREAGLDKGYLKKSRFQHKLILFKISEASKVNSSKSKKSSICLLVMIKV